MERKVSLLLVTDSGGGRKMICTICKSQEEKLMPRANMTFIDGSANFKSSTLLDHVATDGHKRAVKEKNHEDGISTGSSTRPEKVIHEVPTYSAIGSGIRKMTEKEREALIKLYEIVHGIVVKGGAFTDFEDLIELEKLHRVKFQSGLYENESGCKDSIKSIAEYFFKQDIYGKLVRVNFIVVCNETTDANITEQGVVYVFSVDPDSMQPTLEFFECLGHDNSQDAIGIFDAIIAAFQKHDFSSLLQKIMSLL